MARRVNVSKFVAAGHNTGAMLVVVAVAVVGAHINLPVPGDYDDDVIMDGVRRMESGLRGACEEWAADVVRAAELDSDLGLVDAVEYRRQLEIVKRVCPPASTLKTQRTNHKTSSAARSGARSPHIASSA